MEIQITPVKAAEAKEIPTSSGFGFGNVKTNHMFLQTYNPEQGWHDAKIVPYAPLALDPATAVLHYGQEIFEGTKAYRRPDGKINLFRIHDNIRRFNSSAERMGMPSVDEEEHLEAIVQLLNIDHEWVPSIPDSSLYIRPTMIGMTPSLGAMSSSDYLHFVIFTPVEALFSKGFKPVKVFVEDEHVRAVRGGVGAAKTGGNYAASLYVTKRVREKGFAQVLWLDALERRYVEEMGGMNICFVYGDTIKTPQLTGTILPGITRASVIELGRDLGYKVEEAMLDINDLVADAKAGKLTEVFACGTAAVISPIGQLTYKDKDYVVGGGSAGKVTKHIFDELTGIQYGRIPDRFGWTLTIDPER